MATPRARNSPPPAPTWVGGWVKSATYAFDPEPYRPELVLWVRGDEVLASEVVHPSKRDEALTRCLRDALSKAKTLPAVLRVRDASTASLVRAELGGDVPVRVGRVPELDVAAEALLPPIGDPSEESYLSGGRVDPALVGTFFSAAAALFRAAPWRVVPDDSVLFAFDAPSLDVADAAVIVVGQRGVARGVLMFNTVEDYLAFQRAAADEDNDGGDHGAELFAISFVDAPSERRAAEVAAHGWELVAPGVAVGVPVLERFDRDGLQRPLVARDLLVAVALCRVLTRLTIEHPARLAASAGPAVSATFPTQHRGNAAVSRLTLPHPGAEAFDAATAPHREVSVVLRDFLASEVRGRVPGVWRDAAEALVHALLGEKFEGSGLRFDRWPLRLIDDAMARALADLDDARSRRLALDALARFFAWMESTGRLTPALAERLHERARGHLESAATGGDDEAAPPSAIDDGTVDGEALPPGVAEWARSAIGGAKG